MGEREEGIIETKLDILIQDFQRSREEQLKVNKENKDHASKEDAVQSRILTTLRWHTAIGSFMILVIGLIVMDKI